MKKEEAKRHAEKLAETLLLRRRILLDQIKDLEHQLRKLSAKYGLTIKLE